MSCFIASEKTGRTRESECCGCGAIVTHEEVRVTGDGPTEIFWYPTKHRAPCGAHCAAGGVRPFEYDVHGAPIGSLCAALATDSTGSCPRCDPGTAPSS